MSSAILYLAIVAIWAFLLVPRWVRRSHTTSFAGADNAGNAGNAGSEPEQAPAEPGDELTGDPAEFHAGDSDAPRPGILRAVGRIGTRPPDGESAGEYAGSWQEDEQPEPDTAPLQPIAIPQPEEAEPAPAGAPDASSAPPTGISRPVAAPPPVSRAKILQARRRLLTTLVLLAAAAATCTALNLTSGWVCVPPAGMVGMYLLLLREAALADAENVRGRPEQASAARQRARARARQAWAARTPQPTAEIIDISARLGDQLYDQYADATVRAVGD